MEQTTVLIVDRRSVLCDGLSTQLSALADISVVGWATSIGSLTSMIERTHPSVVILDADMVRGDGRTTLARFCESPGAPAFVLIAGTYDADDAMEALRAGATALVLRVGRLEDLVTAIRCARSHQAWISPALLVGLPRHGDHQPVISTGQSESGGERDSALNIRRFLTTSPRLQKLMDFLDDALNTLRTQSRNVRLKLNVDQHVTALSPALKREISA